MTLTYKQQYTDTTAALRTDSLPCAQGGFGCFGEVAEYAVEPLLINNEFKTDCRQAEPCRCRRLRYRNSIL